VGSNVINEIRTKWPAVNSRYPRWLIVRTGVAMVTGQSGLSRHRTHATMKTQNDVSLTLTQRSVLASAIERGDGACAVPDTINRRTAQKSVAGLIEAGLLREIRAKAEMPIWRTDDAGRSIALVTTKRGVEAFRVCDDAGAQTHKRNDPSEPTDTRREHRLLPREGAITSAETSVEAQPRLISKKATIESRVRRKGGATIQDLMLATGWQAHSVRAALTGLRKAGFAIARERNQQGKTFYRIMGAS
jgi:hypothetical protein